MSSFAIHASAQKTILQINGTVRDERNKPLDFVTIKLLNADRQTFTDEKGRFSFGVDTKAYKTITIALAMVGKVSRDTTINTSNYSGPVVITLKDLNLSLDEIQVSAVRKATSLSNSSVIFDRQAIEQVQAFSLTDILNNLPGKKYAALDLQGAQNLTLRSSATGNSSSNNSLGTAIIIDGLAQSNNANMQNRSIGKYGLGSQINDSKNGRSYDVTFGGIDLREIPADNIESIEVISGVAPAQYGDLTDGAVIINRQAGKTDYQFSTRFNGGSTNLSLSKGFKLDGKLGALNTNLNYLISNDDPRDLLKKYKRISAGLMWTARFSKSIKNTLSFDYSNKLDDAKSDPDDGSDRVTYSKNTRYSFSDRLAIEVNHSFLRRISFAIGADMANTDSYTQWFLNAAPKPIANKDTTGVYEGFYTDGIFTAIDQVVGKPINANGNISFQNEFKTGTINHYLSFGASFSLASNKGQGVIYDPEKPRRPNQSNQNERPYNFELLPSLFNTGMYVEDRFGFNVFKKELSFTAGLRYDAQNGKGNLQPRINANYKIAKDWQINMAYGISTKSPTMAYRYPSPTYFDIILLEHKYEGLSKQPLLLFYTEKLIPDNSQLKPSRSSQIELGLSVNKKMFSTSIFGYYKNNKDGFNAQETFHPIVLPVYEFNPDPNAAVPYTNTGRTKLKADLSYSTITNNVSSKNTGIEWFISTKKIQEIQSSFSFNTAFSYSSYFNSGYTIRKASDDDILAGKKAWFGIYKAANNTNWNLTSRLNSDTHIPKLGFVVSMYVDMTWQRVFKDLNDSRFPYAYTDQNGTYIPISDFDPANPDYGHLKKLEASDTQGKLPFPYANLSMRLSKEIRKRIRFSVNAYNVLNIQPNYYNSITKSRITYTDPISIGAEFTVKF